MRRITLISAILLLSLAFPLARVLAQSEPPPAPTGITYLPVVFHEETVLTALYRSGQTFITWPERTDLQGERYRIYRSNERITAENLSQARLLAEVGKDSASFYTNRYNIRDASGKILGWQVRYSGRLYITSGDNPVPTGRGLLVWTLAPEDFDGGQVGVGNYAVTVIPPGGQEIYQPLYTLGRVYESVADPLPVEITNSPGIKPAPGEHIYIQYMDLRRWNPTFHAPNPSNDYYGLNPSDPNLRGALQYAYDYTVFEPDRTKCFNGVPEQMPVFLHLHGWKGNNYPPLPSYPDPFCAYGIYPVDVSDTWYFGFARYHDYRLDDKSDPQAGDVIANYTERRVLRMVFDLLRQPPALPADEQRIYVDGQSMGGTGTLAFAERYPNVFAAAYSSQPMTNFMTAGITKMDWGANVAVKWGPQSLNLPISLDAPNGWAERLKKYNQTGVWDWENLQSGLAGRPADEMVPLGVAHATNDRVITWATQGQPVYPLLDTGKRVWGGAATYHDTKLGGNGHQWEYYAGLPPSLGSFWRENAGLVFPGVPFWDLRVVRDETIPGLSRLNGVSLASNFPTPTQFGQSLKWSSSWDPWDGVPVDEENRWQISLCVVVGGQLGCATGQDVGNAYIDVTPRRLQHFIITPGAAYTWENRDRNNTLLASGTVTPGADGLLTIPGVLVIPSGNRVSIVKQ